MLYGEFNLACYADEPIAFPRPGLVLQGSFDDLVDRAKMTVDPTRQRLHALDQSLDTHSGGAFDLDNVTQTAATDLNTYFADPELSRMIFVGHCGPLLASAELIENLGGFRASNPLFFQASRAMIEHLKVIAIVAPAVPELEAARSKTPVGAVVAQSISTRGRLINSMDNTQTALRAKEGDLKWPSKFLKGATQLDDVINEMFPHDSAMGIRNLSFSLNLAVAEAVKHRQAISDRVYMSQPGWDKSPAPRAPKIKPEPKPVIERTYDHAAAEELINFVPPLSTAQAKEHPLADMLKRGARVTLAAHHEFGGFGDKALLAASFVEYMADLPEEALEHYIKNTAAWLREAQELVSSGAMNPDDQRSLAAIVNTCNACLTLDFCAVAKNVHPCVDPKVARAVRHLHDLRAHLEAQTIAV